MSSISTNGVVFALTNSVELIEYQIGNGGIRHQLDFDNVKDDLADNISTDEITPGWCCFWYNETLSDYAYLGFRSKNIKAGDIKNIAPSVIVSGKSKGCGSSREHSPYAEKAAGAKIILAESFEKIYYQNCINIGLLPTTNFAILDDVFNNNDIQLTEIMRGMSKVDKDIVNHGGLFAYNVSNHEKKKKVTIFAKDQPLNLMQKITQNKLKGVGEYCSGDVVFCDVDLRFSHEYVTPMSHYLFKNEFGENAVLSNPDSIVCFQDHLTYIKDSISKDKTELIEQATSLIEEQESFALENNLKYYSGSSEQHQAAICHNAILEDLALPGQVIIGTDSHTCTAGAMGGLAFGVGATDMANAWFTEDVKFALPRTIKIELKGQLPQWITGKDLVLHLLAHPLVQTGETIGSVLIYCGEGVASFSMDERATIANMAVEMGAMTAIFEVDSVTIGYLTSQRGGKGDDYSCYKYLTNDKDAIFDDSISVDLNGLSPSVALPGDPRNAHSLSDVLSGRLNRISIDIAYGGSCTGGKNHDMDMYANVIQSAQQKGLTKSDDVAFYIQFGSDSVKQYCLSEGYIELFENFGVILIEPSCGACINAGPGVSKRDFQVTISSQNRNFPGRSGPGSVYLASPIVVAIASVFGYIVEPDKFFALV